MLVISDLNEDLEYSIRIFFIVILETFSDMNKVLKAKLRFLGNTRAEASRKKNYFHTIFF